MKTETLKKFEENVCAAIDSSIDSCDMTKSMSSAALFDELRLLIESTVPKNSQEKKITDLSIQVTDHQSAIQSLSSQVIDLHPAVQSLQERQHERDAILHALPRS